MLRQQNYFEKKTTHNVLRVVTALPETVGWLKIYSVPCKAITVKHKHLRLRATIKSYGRNRVI